MSIYSATKLTFLSPNKLKFETYFPSGILKPYIRKFVLSDIPGEHTSRVLPDSSVVMGFQFGGKLSLPKKKDDQYLSHLCITGISNTFRLFKNSADFKIVLVYFTPSGASAFFHDPLQIFYGESISLENFERPSVIEQVEEQLHEAGNERERIRLIEKYLISRLRPIKPDPLVCAALQHIYRTKGTIRIAELADQLCISQSPLEKRFRKKVGCTPKKFASIVRLRNLVSLAPHSQNLTQVALDAGYYDQAHFNKDFKSFTGLSPLEYFQTFST